jgi:hypothetical protein
LSYEALPAEGNDLAAQDPERSFPGETGEESEATSGALLSEPALADWNREEEDAAWAHLQSRP